VAKLETFNLAASRRPKAAGPSPARIIRRAVVIKTGFFEEKTR
jgi:hypothetical protein